MRREGIAEVKRLRDLAEWYRGFAKVVKDSDPQTWIRFASILDGMADEEERQGVASAARGRGPADGLALPLKYPPAGLRVDLSKAGASLSVGRRGGAAKCRPRGSGSTVGLPGSGLSYPDPASAIRNWPRHHRAGHAARSNAAPLLGFIILLAMGALLFATR